MMLHSSSKRVALTFSSALILAAVLAVSGCSDDSGANNGTAPNNGQADAAQQLDAADEDTGTESDADRPDTTQSDTTEADTAPGPPKWLPDFKYRNPNQGSGVSVNIIIGRVGKIGSANTLSDPMSDQEIAALEDEILTEATRDKMISGWDCGDATEVNGVQWTFEGRVLVDVDNRDYDEIITNVAGCVPADSTEADAARVQEIIAHLDALKDVHFD
jgi:hypothetical protein